MTFAVQNDLGCWRLQVDKTLLLLQRSSSVGHLSYEGFRRKTENTNLACWSERGDVAAALHAVRRDTRWWQNFLCCWQGKEDASLKTSRSGFI